MYRVNKYISFISLLLFVQINFAQEVSFSASVNRTNISTDETVQITFKSNSDGNFTAPDFKDFKILSGPNKGSSSQISIINGVMSQSYTITWSFILRPTKEGELTINSAKLNVNGKEYKTHPVKISVGKGSGQFNTDNGSNPYQNNKPIFTSVSVSKNKVYQGEPLVATYKLYMRTGRITDYDIKIPIQNGFWSQEIDPGKQGWPQYIENLNGIDYVVVPLKKELLYPNSFGKFKLKPYDLMAIVQFSFWDSRRFDLVSNSPEIEVMPLPAAGKPEDFSGAVGSFKMETNFSTTELKANDGIDIKIKISGTGNFKLMDKPVLKVPADFEMYDPETKDKLSVTEKGMSGSREFNYLIIPRHSGKYLIEPINFSYFDTDSRSYKTLRSEPQEINVLKNDNEPEQNATVKNDLKIITTDIAYLKTYENDSINTDNFVIAKKWYYFLYLSTLPIFLTFIFFIRKRKNINEQTHKMQKATKIALKRLRQAKQHLDNKQSAAFYNELHKALLVYLSDKCGIQFSEQNKENIKLYLNNKNADTELCRLFIDILQTCEMARYARQEPGSEQILYNNAINLIEKLEKVL
jgi:hypothetical protein